MAEKTAQGTALQKKDVANSRSVQRAEAFHRMDAAGDVCHDDFLSAG